MIIFITNVQVSLTILMVYQPFPLVGPIILYEDRLGFFLLKIIQKRENKENLIAAKQKMEQT